MLEYVKMQAKFYEDVLESLCQKYPDKNKTTIYTLEINLMGF